MKWLTKKEACSMLGVHVNTLDRWVKKKKLVCYKMGNEKLARVKFKQEDIEKYIKKSKI